MTNFPTPTQYRQNDGLLPLRLSFDEAMIYTGLDRLTFEHILVYHFRRYSQHRIHFVLEDLDRIIDLAKRYIHGVPYRRDY